MSKVLDSKQMNQLGQYLDFLSFLVVFWAKITHNLGNSNCYLVSRRVLKLCPRSTETWTGFRKDTEWMTASVRQRWRRDRDVWTLDGHIDLHPILFINKVPGLRAALLILTVNSRLSRLIDSLSFPDWREWKSISSLSLCFSFLYCFYCLPNFRWIVYSLLSDLWEVFPHFFIFICNSGKDVPLSRVILNFSKYFYYFTKVFESFDASLMARMQNAGNKL